VRQILARADLRLYRLVRSAARPPASTVVSRFSVLGEHAGLWIALGSVGAVVDAPRRARWQRGVTVVAATYVVNTTIKAIVRRPRPRLEGLPALVATPSGLTFPSAHASTSFAAARVYGDLVPPAPLYATAVLMACSRVYLGVHYPSDVATGVLLGLALGSVLR
jgi:decaprenylphosphoryl-5-phosphoribose phosphatase